MLRVVSCLTTQHDWRLIVLAGLVCFLTSVAAVHVFHRGLATTGRTQALWLATTGAAAGYGVWATHFIAMLAYSPGIPVGYSLLLILASLGAAALITGIGFAFAALNRTTTGILGGGALFGVGIAVMHFSGMAALAVPGYIVWAPDLLIASIVFGIGFGAAALYAAVRLKGTKAMLLAASLVALAILAHHFTAMGAVEIIPEPWVPVGGLSLSPYSLSVAIASAAATVVGLSLIAALNASSRQQLIETSDAEIAKHAGRLEVALANMSQGLCLFDESRRVVVANRRYAEIYGLDPALLKSGTPLQRIIEARAGTGSAHKVDANKAFERAIADFEHEVRETVELEDGRFISILQRPLADGGFISTHEDITTRRLVEARSEHLAHHDSLTGLPNRLLLRERMEQALADLDQGENGLALLLLDLDRFKEVNDTLGHAAGDQLLPAASQRLHRCLRNGDTLARLGGDEFAIVQRTRSARAHSIALAKRLHEAIDAPFELGGYNANVGVSIGIAIAPEDGNDPDQLLKNADLALYKAKDDGRGKYQVFEPEMDRRIQARRVLEMDLRAALERGEFLLHYQPLINVERDEICGCEALVRWNHPERGLVAPGEFIPLAEETGLIIPLGAWVLRQACMTASAWPDHLKIAVNVSTVQFKTNLIELVAQTLAETHLAPGRLELEITESVMIEDQQAAMKALTRLHEIGVRISLDDFGTGYSSLSLLRKFPFDKIKIDRSFVEDLSTANFDALAVVRAVARLGNSLGMDTTAEGVETKEQADRVRAEGCTEMQGYYLCPPGSAADIEKLIKASVRSPASAA